MYLGVASLLHQVLHSIAMYTERFGMGKIHGLVFKRSANSGLLWDLSLYLKAVYQYQSSEATVSDQLIFVHYAISHTQ